MSPFEIAFPGFVTACGDLYRFLLPVGMGVLVSAFAFEFWHGPLQAGELVKFVVKIAFIVQLLANSHELINSGQAWVQNLVQQHIPASPEKVAARYKQKLAEAQDAPEEEDESFLSRLFSANWFEAIILAVLTLLSWLAMALLFFIYSVQRASLLLCWAMGPLLFPLLAIRPFNSVGMRHVLRTLAIMLWPIGLALAATFTDGLIDVTADKKFLSDLGIGGALGRGLISMVAVMVIAVWILFSTVAAPVFIQRIIAGDFSSTPVLTKSADLMANVGLPSGFGIPQAARGVRRAGHYVRERVGRVWERARGSKHRAAPDYYEATNSIIASSPPPTMPPTSASTWKPQRDDPTGDRQAAEIVKNAKSK